MSLLDEAIKAYNIPKWPYQPVYDRIVVFSVPEDRAARETYTPGGLIVKTQERQKYEKTETPRGIVVAAGLGAMDVMRSHGIDLGHMVWVARLAPWRHEVDRTEKGAIEFLFLRVGDIVGSEDLLQSIHRHDASITTDSTGNHHYVLSGSAVPRFDPPSYGA